MRAYLEKIQFLGTLLYGIWSCMAWVFCLLSVDGVACDTAQELRVLGSNGLSLPGAVVCVVVTGDDRPPVSLRSISCDLFPWKFTVQ